MNPGLILILEEFLKLKFPAKLHFHHSHELVMLAELTRPEEALVHHLTFREDS